MRTDFARIALAATLAGGLALAGQAMAQAAGTKLSASLNGANEKPRAGDAKGTGEATVTVKGDQICYKLSIKDLKPAMAAHIHKGGADAAGPVAMALKPPDANGNSSGCSNDAKLAKDLVAHPGDYYVNVHTAQYKAGAIRGQLSK
jgi:Cu/Zn superoxide dismutase